jgi:Domain of unknown function (DUF1830)
MTYLLSLLTAESPSKDSTQILCCYLNDTGVSQIIRVMSGVSCYFERVVFSREYLLFEALPESYLEVYSPQVYSPLIKGVQSSKIECKLLQVNEKPDLLKSLSQSF